MRPSQESRLSCPGASTSARVEETAVEELGRVTCPRCLAGFYVREAAGSTARVPWHLHEGVAPS